MNNDFPRVSIITINYNQTEVTSELLASLRGVTYPDIEIIVVDNNSDENPNPILTSRFPEIKFIRSNKNLGFAGGNNLGLTQATGEYILFLNNDTEVDPDFLQPLVSVFESNPKAGAASPKILYFKSGNLIQYAGSTRVNPFTGRSRRLGYLEKDRGQHDRLRETDLTHGAAMIVPRRVIDAVGPMPDFFFLYYEEIDWCESIKRAGYRIYYVPQSRVFHKESMSIGKKSTLKTYYMTRNRLLFMRRNTSGLEKMLWISFFIFISLPKNILSYVFRRDIPNGLAFWKGMIWNVTHQNDGNKSGLFLRTLSPANENRN